MITVYGADWCEDTRRTRRHLRRLSVPHRYFNVDEDLDALHRAMALNAGTRRTPSVDLGTGGPALVEPDNDALTGALVELAMLTPEDAYDLLAVQNVGDLERFVRAAAGVGLLAAAWFARRPGRAPLALLGAYGVLSAIAGWCPLYHVSRVTSLGGPGDRPYEAARNRWLARNPVGVTVPKAATEVAR